MKKLAVILAILFQLVALSWMALSREYVLQTGELVKIQTAPIDPRDLFRGDFVRLTYAMSEVSSGMLEDALKDKELKKGDVLYARLETSASGIASLTSIHESPSEDGSHYLKARVQNNVMKPKNNNQVLRLKYGIEQYFVEQDKGIEIEKKRGGRNEVQVPMIMHIALSGSGTAIIKDHEWSRLGIGLSVENQPDQNALREEASASLKLVLKNVGDEVMQLPVKSENCSFSIVNVASAPESMRKKPATCDSAKSETKQLQPGQSLEFLFNFNDPLWWVEYKKKPTPLGKLPWGYRFRIIYDEIDETGITGVEIVSRAFHGRGQVD